MKYIAYGSNMSVSQMAQRCPDATLLGTGKLYCAKCGAPMAGTSGTSCTGATYHYYKCRKCRRT